MAVRDACNQHISKHNLHKLQKKIVRSVDSRIAIFSRLLLLSSLLLLLLLLFVCLCAYVHIVHVHALSKYYYFYKTPYR